MILHSGSAYLTSSLDFSAVRTFVLQARSDLSALLPNADVLSTVDEVLSHSSESRLDLFGGELVGRVDDRKEPPFSRLLQAACDHVEKTNSVIIFESPALQAIVQ